MKVDAPINKNEHYTMIIDDIGNSGEGIGKINGFTVFVENALPLDEIEVRIVKIRKSFAFGKLINIITPSPDRIEPICKFFQKCGGCQLQHLSYQAQLKYKTKKVWDCVERIGELSCKSIKPAVGMDNPFNYRNKAQFPVGTKDGELVAGFYSPRSHNIMDIDSCLIQNSKNDEIIKLVKEFTDENNIMPYNEKDHTGLIRHILTKVGFTTGEIMVCLVVNGKKIPYVDKLIKKLTEIQGMKSIVININRKKTNVILGDQTEVLWGNNHITDYIGDIKFKISPLSFFQVNPVQTKILYEKALDLADLNGNENVLDIYCGIGSISLFFARKCKNVVGVEVVPEAIKDAIENAKINSINNADFRVGLAEDIIPNLYEKEGFYADVVIVDPPRKGCDESVLKTIIDMNPKKVIYVSCEPSTLARDLKILCGNGFSIDNGQIVDQFPMTTHVETITKLVRE